MCLNKKFFLKKFFKPEYSDKGGFSFMQNNFFVEKKIAKTTVISSLLWKFLERCGVQGVQLVLSVILARILSPADYGLVAILLVFISISNVFIQSGFNTALIQKQKCDEIDFSSVFYLSLIVSLFLYFLIFISSPFIEIFFRKGRLSVLLRVISITLFFGAMTSVQSAYVARTMQFKRFFFSSMGATILSGVVGIFMAYKNFGVWALVVQHILNTFFSCVILWVTVRWRPKAVFSFSRIKELFSFGWKILCSALLDTVFRNIYSLVIGRVYTDKQLGFFNRGHQFPQVIATNLDGSIQNVMLPTLSSMNDNTADLKRVMRRSISSSAFILMPCMFGLAAIAKPLVVILLGEKWIPCVPFLQLACFSYAIYPIHTANLTAINAVGRSDIFLKLEIIKKTLTVITLTVTVPLGIYAMAAGQVITGILGTFINSYPNKKLMNYSYFEQIKDLLPSFLISVFMAFVVYLLKFISIPLAALLVIQLVTGFILYIFLSHVFKVESFLYLSHTIAECLSDLINKKRQEKNNVK